MKLIRILKSISHLKCSSEYAKLPLTEEVMRELIWSVLFSIFVLFLTAALLKSFQVENLPQVIVGGFIVGILNFIIAPMLLVLRVKPNMFTLGFTTFALNFVVLNVATGLIDEFGVDSWVAALFGAGILTFFQVLMDTRDPSRRKLIG